MTQTISQHFALSEVCLKNLSANNSLAFGICQERLPGQNKAHDFKRLQMLQKSGN